MPHDSYKTSLTFHINRPLDHPTLIRKPRSCNNQLNKPVGQKRTLPLMLVDSMES